MHPACLHASLEQSLAALKLDTVLLHTDCTSIRGLGLHLLRCQWLAPLGFIAELRQCDRCIARSQSPSAQVHRRQLALLCGFCSDLPPSCDLRPVI